MLHFISIIGEQVHLLPDDGYKLQREECTMIGHLERMFLDGEITEEEYLERKKVYLDTILEMYIKGIITKEELMDRINK